MTQTEIAPGLVLGPMDPDNTSELTKNVGVHNRANALLKRHSANFPQALTIALSKPLDEERTKTLDLEEVESVLRGLSGRRAFFKSGDVLEDASVRGRTEGDRVVSVIFRKPVVKGDGTDEQAQAGRSSQGAIPYSALTRSIAAHDEFLEQEKAGTPWGIAQALSGQASQDPQQDPNAELLERLDKMDQALRESEDRARQAEVRAQEAEAKANESEDPEPVPGFAEADAKTRVAIVQLGIGEHGRTGLERIRTYEESHRKAASVLDAIEDELAKHPENDPS